MFVQSVLLPLSFPCSRPTLDFFFFFLEQLQAAADPNVLLIPGLDLFSLNSDLRFLRPHKWGHDEKCPLNPRLPALEAPGVGWGVGRTQSEEQETSCHAKGALGIAEPSSFPDQGESD